jgi:hypothetical protein
MKIWIFALICLLPVLVFSMAGKIEKIPMKPYPVINIPDGEFLRYGIYNRGEKISDTYYVTRKIADKNGAVLYRIYWIFIDTSSSRKPPADYTNWPNYDLIDPKLGLVLEAGTYLSTNKDEMKKNAVYGMGDTVETHYQLYRDENFVEFNQKSIGDNGVTENKSKVSVKPGFSSWEGQAYFMLSPRFMDSRSGGILYLVAPTVLKEPIPVILKSGVKSILSTKAGSFHVNKIETVMADPFIEKLYEPIAKKSGYWVEDSDRRLMIKIQQTDIESFLEEISNVK